MSSASSTIFSSLKKDEKQAISLLSIGTFLEYFDLMLYVHMAVVLNDLFFPKSDPHTTKLLSALAFCTSFVFRPLGSWVFGKIGDSLGRKTTIILTTSLMAFCCIVMALLPEYSKIGISATWIMLGCRILQGVSSMGEIFGADLYIIETIKTRDVYPCGTIITVMAILGGTVALGIATLVTSYSLFNWRYAFWFGAAVATIGVAARTALRETPDFADAKRRFKETLEKMEIEPESILKHDQVAQEKMNSKTTIAYFLMSLASPLAFYFSFVHCAGLLKDLFGLSPEEIIHQNFIVSLFNLPIWIIVTYLSHKIYPLLILKVKLIILTLFLLTLPFLLSVITTPFQLMLIQIFIISFVANITPATPIMFSYFPIFKRFTYSAVIYSLAGAGVFIITSFGMIYLTDIFGNYGILIIMLLSNIAFAIGLFHFEKLEKNSNGYALRGY